VAKNRKTPNMNFPVWFDGQNINEALFCEEFLHERRIIFANGAFFTPDGRVTDDLPLRGEIYDKLKFCAVNNIPRKITNILEVLKLEAQVSDFPPEQDRIHVANGTLLLNGTFTEGRPAIVRSRLPVGYNPDAPAPVIWLNFLDGLLYAEDIPTLQEFIGYCLIPSNKGQRMMVIKGNGGEGKSQIGAVLSTIFGTNMKDGSIGKISENRFARADLEHILLCVDDDMRMEALRQTNYVKSIVTAQGKMDLERKGKQSYQGWMFARLLAFSNGDLQALYADEIVNIALTIGGTPYAWIQALRCRCIYRSKPQDCRRFSVPLRRAAPPEQSRLPALRRGLYATQAETRRTQSPAHGRISSFRARGNLFLCIGGVNALHGLTDTIRALGVREVVEAIGLDQMTNPNVRKAVLAMQKEVQKIPAFAIQSTHGKPPAREWTITS